MSLNRDCTVPIFKLIFDGLGNSLSNFFLIYKFWVPFRKKIISETFFHDYTVHFNFFSLIFEKIHGTNKQQKILILLNRANIQFRYKRKISKHSKAATKKNQQRFRAQNSEK